MSDDIRVADNPGKRRFEVYLDDRLAGFAVYVTDGQRVVFVHTEVDPAFEGHGLGSKLAKDALDDVRRRGLRAVPQCPFIAAYIRRHPEYGDLVDEAA